MMDTLNLVKDINTKQDKNKLDTFNTNLTSESYNRYLELLDNYFSESVKNKYNSKFKYFIDDEGDFIKKAINKEDEKDNTTLIKPIYINIDKRLFELNIIIKNTETILRNYRTKILNNDNSVKEEFDSLVIQYNEMIKEKEDIKEYNKTISNIDNIIKLKQDNININLEQYNLKKELSLENNKKYILNNEIINDNLLEIKKLKIKKGNEFIVKEVFNNKSKKKSKKSKKSKEPTEQKEQTIDDQSFKKYLKQWDNSNENFEATKERLNQFKSEELDLGGEDDDSFDLTKEIIVNKDELDLGGEDDDFDLTKAINVKNDGELDLGGDDELIDLTASIGNKKVDELDLTKELKNNENNNDDDEIDLSGLKEIKFGDGDGDGDGDDITGLFDEKEEEFVFNTSGKSKEQEDEDADIPALFNLDSDSKKPTKSTKPKKSNESIKVNPDIDIDKLSKSLKKPVKDPKIKIIKVDPNLQFSNIKCDDTTTKRSSIKTTDEAGGKKRRKKTMDKDLKNCIFPFKEYSGKGTSKKETIYNECAPTGIEDWCATERKDDCTANKWAYCKK